MTNCIRYGLLVLAFASLIGCGEWHTAPKEVCTPPVVDTAHIPGRADSVYVITTRICR